MARPLINFSTTCGNNTETQDSLPQHSGLLFTSVVRMACAAYLSGCGVRIDGDLARASSMTVHSGAHLLSHQQGGDLLLGGNKLTSLGLLQGFSDESGVALDLCAWKALAYPESDSITHLFTFIAYITKIQSIVHTHTNLLRWKRRYLRMARLGRKVQLMQVRRCQWARLAGLLG